MSVFPDFLKLTLAKKLAELTSRPGKVYYKCLSDRLSESHPTTLRKCTAK